MKATKKAESAAHRKLGAELSSLIPALDEEGLSFLIEQAYVHLHNREVERQEAEYAAEEAAASAAPEESAKRRAAGKRSAGKAAAATPENARPADFRIERSASGASYHIISGGKWKMFNEEEMMALVKIAAANNTLPEVAYRLHAWFEEERPDTFADLEIGDKHDPKLKELVLFLRSKFAIKKR